MFMIMIKISFFFCYCLSFRFCISDVFDTECMWMHIHGITSAVPRQNHGRFESKTRPKETEDNDDDNDYSFNQLSVHKALTCPEGQSAWAAAPSSLAKDIRSTHR